MSYAADDKQRTAAEATRENKAKPKGEKVKRDFLKGLGIEDKDVIDKIMDENSKDIGAEAAKVTAAEAAKATAEADKVKAETALKAKDTEIATLKTAAQGTEALQAQINTLTAEKAAFDTKLKDVHKLAAAKIKMADKVHDVDIAAGLIDLSDVEVDDKGAITKGDIDAKVKALTDAKPFLAKTTTQQQQQPGKPTGFKPAEGTGGTGGTGSAKTLGEAVAAAYTTKT